MFKLNWKLIQTWSDSLSVQCVEGWELKMTIWYHQRIPFGENIKIALQESIYKVKVYYENWRNIENRIQDSLSLVDFRKERERRRERRRKEKKRWRLTNVNIRVVQYEYSTVQYQAASILTIDKYRVRVDTSIVRLKDHSSRFWKSETSPA